MATYTISFAFGSTWKTLDAALTWTDVSAYVLVNSRIRIDRGRQSELDSFAAGVCQFTLGNSARRFDPQYSAGPYFGQLVPGVPVKIEATANAVTEQLFRGFVQGWPQRYDLADKTAYVPVVASDGFRRVGRADLPESVWMLEASTDPCWAWWRLNETSGTIASDSSGNKRDAAWQQPRSEDVNNSAVPAYANGASIVAFDGAGSASLIGDTTGTAAIGALLQSDVVPSTNLPLTVEMWLIHDIGRDVGTDYPFTALFNGYKYDISADTAVGATTFQLAALWRNPVAGTSRGTALSAVANLTDQPHHLVVIFTASDVSVYLNGIGTTASGTIPGLGAVEAKQNLYIGGYRYVQSATIWDGRISDVRVYDTALGAARIAAHYDAGATPWTGDTTDERVTRILNYLGWPSDLRNLDVGQSTLGPTALGGKALAYLKNTEASEQGRMFIGRDGKFRFLNRYYFLLDTHGTTAQAILSDDGLDTPYTDMGFDYDDSLIINKATGSRFGGGTIEVVDATSRDSYGEAPDTELSNLQLASDDNVRSLLEYRVDRYKNPALRLPNVKVPLFRQTAAQQAALLGLELGYRVNVERTPLDVGAVIDIDEIIEGIHHDIGGGGEHWVTFDLSAVDTRQYAVWDTAVWDDANARWAF